MFGYLRVQRCGLEQADRKLYSAHFCSVCHHLHRNAGWDTSVLTNYDVTLWNIVASGVSAECYRLPVEQRACTVLPFRRVWVQPLTADVGASLAAVTVLLVWAKLEDARQDGGRLLPGVGKMWLGSKERKAESYLRGVGYPVETLLDIPRLQKLSEARTPVNLEDLSLPTRAALSEAFAWIGKLAGRPDLDTRLRRLGSAIAEFVYLWDALDDLEKDLKKGDFNAVERVWGARPVWAEVKGFLLSAIDALEEEVRLLPLGDRRPICLKLATSLRARVARHPKLQAVAPRYAGGPRRRAQAGFVAAQCGCDGGCCDCGCCDGGGDGCNCCEASCCDCKPGDSCCECNCNRLCCPCSNCCGDTGGGGCCDSGGSSCGQDLCCCCGDSSTTTTDEMCCCFGSDDHDEPAKKRSSDSGTDALAEQPRPPLLLCPGCRQDLIIQRKGTYTVHGCEGCQAFWIDRESLEAAKNSVGEEALRDSLRGGPEELPISRGQRMCPVCTSLLRSPSDSAEPESCSTCGGRFYSP